MIAAAISMLGINILIGCVCIAVKLGDVANAIKKKGER